jgi:hypothetical protein
LPSVVILADGRPDRQREFPAAFSGMLVSFVSMCNFRRFEVAIVHLVGMQV